MFIVYFLFLSSISVSRAKIIGNTELFIKSGSDIRLTCVASQTPEPPSYIYWYKGSRVINYTQRGGINVLIERQTKTSKLIITKAQPSDSGNYTCAPSNSGNGCVDTLNNIQIHSIARIHCGGIVFRWPQSTM